VWPAQYSGRYLFGDYVCGRIQTLTQAGGSWVAGGFGDDMGPVTDLRFGPWNSTEALYYLTFEGRVGRIAYTGNSSPVAVAGGTPTAGPVPLSVGFIGSASRDPDGGALSYEWNFGDGSAPDTTANPRHTYTQAGTYLVTLRVTDDEGATDVAGVRIDSGNNAPTPAISSPAASLRFRVGQAIALRGSATDAEDGTLPPSSLEWTVLLHHNTHTHPFLGPTKGNDIGFEAPAPEDLAAAGNSYLELRLKATDSKGVTRTVSQDLRPHTVGLLFDVDPDGVPLSVDGVRVTGYSGFTSWEGYRFSVSAPALAVAGGKAYSFTSWSDGGAARHTITTPASSAGYSARYTQAQCGGGVGVAMLLVMAGSAIGRFRRRLRGRSSA
jgi:PKD domain